MTKVALDGFGGGKGGRVVPLRMEEWLRPQWDPRGLRRLYRGFVNTQGRPAQRLGRLPRFTGDVLLSLGVGGVQLLLLSVAAQDSAPGAEPLGADTVMLIWAQALPLIFRRRWPVLVFVTILIPNTIYYAMGFPPSGLDLGLAVALYTVAALRPRPVSLAACGVILVTCTSLWLLAVGPYWANATVALFVYLLVFFSAAWAWGRYHRANQKVRDAYVAELIGQAQQSERDRAAERERAIDDERRRIARELHDSIAHHVSVMVVQAGAARRVLDTDIDDTREALATIEETGRRGLDMMPSLINALRGSEKAGGFAPQPVLGDLPQLVQLVNGSGLSVSLDCSVVPDSIPPAVELSAYRIVQEALTNCIRHAAGAAVQVRLTSSPTSLDVEVCDMGGRRTATASSDSGHGLVGMQERVSLFGGQFAAAPNQQGGFTVRATFPIPGGSR